MNIRQDPGCAPGFERSVNAEAGPMGAGAGAAAAIDNNEPSPRGAAIEKAQAELRRDLAVREERRRELEFLEKGGEPLDFEFGEAPVVSFSRVSPKEAVVDGLVPVKSEGDGAVDAANVVIDGELSNGSRGCGGAVDGMSVALVPGNEQACGRLSSVDVGDPSWASIECGSKTDVDGSEGGHGRGERRGHVIRNRVWSQTVGNGHVLSEEVEGVSGVAGGDGQVAERESTGAPGSAENEDMIDMSYQVLPQQSQHGLPGKWSGLSTSPEYEPVNEIRARCVPVLEQQASERGSRDRAGLSSVKSGQASDVRGGSRGVGTGRDSERASVGGECSPHGGAAEGEEREEQAAGVGERRDGRAGGRQTGGAVDTVSSRIRGDDAGGVDEASEKRDGVRCSTGVGAEKFGESGAGAREAGGSVEEKQGGEARGARDSRSQIPGDGWRGGSTHRDPRVVKKSGGPSRGGSHVRVGRAGAEEKKVNVHEVRLKAEDGVGGDRTKQLATQAEPGRHENDGAQSQELRTGAQAGAAVGGAPRSVGRPPSNSGAANCRYPGVVLPWEQGQDSAVQAEAERVREKLANKAREDFILEEAEHLKVKRKLLEERKTLKAIADPPRRKSHWDYVLEEMKWMANDFWQERMWKRYQAAHVCLEIAVKKGEDEFLAAELGREQHRVARILAGAVKDFWRSAEVAVRKEKGESRSSGQEQGVRRTAQSEVVPMDVDCPVPREGPEKAARHEKGGREQLIGVQKYAIELLREWGLATAGQAESPVTPERRREGNSILDKVREVPLLYEVPMGCMEAYRAAVEAEHARAEEEYERRRAAARAEAEAEGGDDASVGGDGSYAELSNDGGSQEDEPAIFTAEGSRISKKKRKKILKTSSIGSRGEGGISYRAAGLLSSEAGVPSPQVTGKRSAMGGSGANSLPGSIPVKRARSSAANLRPRGTQPGASPGAYTGQRVGGSQFSQDEGMDAADGSNQGDVGSDTPGSKGMAGDGRVKKKKKTRPYPGLSYSDGGSAAETPAKSADGVGQELRAEQMKRKADTHWVSIVGPEGGLDNTPGTPGSQGLSGQQNSKKQKSLRQAETSSEAGQAGQQAGAGVGVNKLVRQNSMRDRNRRVRPASKVPPSTPTGGVGIPWSAGEDQAILALVHDLGANWELVSDVLSSSSQIKGICRKPAQCKERHKALTERVGSEGLENTEDPSSSQAQASKGSVRGPRGQSAAEEDTLKHFEQIILVVQKHGARKNPQSESEEQKVLPAPHPSHGIIVSQFGTGINGTSNPVELADRSSGNDDPGAQQHPAQPAQGNGLGPGVVGPMAGLGMRPPAGGLPLVLPGPNGLHSLGQGSISAAAMSAAAARDAQRLNMSNFSSEEHGRQMATKQLTDYNARRAQQQAASVASGVPVLGGLASSNGVPMLSTSTSGGMLVGLNRGMPLPRAGLAGMGSPVVSSMGTAGLSGRLPPSGNLAASNVSRRIAGLVNVARSAGCSEEQRVQALQQLQSMAQQGDGQAGAALLNLTGGGGDMGIPVDGLNQAFSMHHQHPLQQQQHPQEQNQHQQLLQQQLQHMSSGASKLQAQVQQHGHQMQLVGAPQAYVPVPTRMKEQQQQQQQHQHLQRQQQQLHQLQQQQKQKLLGNLGGNPQAQHMLGSGHGAAAASLPGQHLKSQPHILPPQQHNSLQKQLMQQVGSPSQGAQVSVASSSLQSSAASPAKSGQAGTGGQPNERAGQMPQGGLSGAKPPQPSQGQKQAEQTSQMLAQQQATRNSKGVGRGPMLMQGPPAQAAQTSSAAGGANGQAQVEVGGQRGQAQGGNAGSGSQAGNPGGGQSQGGQMQGPQAQTLSSAVGGQKGFQQQQSPQGGVGKQEQGGASQAGGQSGVQQAGPASSSGQLAAAVASLGGPGVQGQQTHRRQVAQAQPPRRLQTKHPSTSMGLPIPGQLGKMGAQAAGQGVPSQVAQGGQNPYQFIGTMPMGNPNLHGIPLSSGVNSGLVGAQSAQWKPNQTLPPLGGGIYNLTRTSSPGPGQGPAMVSAGPQSNGNMGASPLSSPGVQGAGVGNASQGVGGAQGSAGLVSQKVGAGPGMSGRGVAGAQLGAVGGQRIQPNGSAPLPSGAGSMGSYQARPPTASSASASPTNSAGSSIPQVGAAGGAQQGASAGTSGPTASIGQPRQAHGEQASSITSALPRSASGRGGIVGASGSGPSGSTILPSAPDQGAAASAEPTAAPSS